VTFDVANKRDNNHRVLQSGGTGLQVEGAKRALGAHGRGSFDHPDAGEHRSARSRSFVAGCR
jgi:hypothetical protein